MIIKCQSQVCRDSVLWSGENSFRILKKKKNKGGEKIRQAQKASKKQKAQLEVKIITWYTEDPSI